MTGTDDIDRERNYRLGYATELIRQFVAHFDRGDEAALSHSVETARRFLAQGPDL